MEVAVDSALHTLAKEPALIARHSHGVLRHGGEGHKEHACLLMVEQAVRLAAFFHDLGHLPFSHEFETALEDYWDGLKKCERERSPLRGVILHGSLTDSGDDAPDASHNRMKIHEGIGHAVAEMLLRETLRAKDTILDRVESTEAQHVKNMMRVCFSVAREILIAESTPKADATVMWLHALIDGEIDADRCDFILRDARNYGFEFASYDLQRLLDNMVVVSTAERDPHLAVRYNGISAVESFLTARYRSYQYAVRHHKVAQIGAALRYCIVTLLKRVDAGERDSISDEIGDFVSTLEAIYAHNPEDINANIVTLSKFARYDDIWLMTQLRALDLHKPGKEWAALVCWRQSNPGPYSLWKRADDFPVGIDIDDLKSFNRGLNSLDDNAWRKCAGDVKARQMLVTRHIFSPLKTDIMIVRRDGDLVSIRDIAPSVGGLEESWKSDIQVQVFVPSTTTFDEAKVSVLADMIDPLKERGQNMRR